MQHRQARGARGGLRPAGDRADRPRRHERRRRAVQGGPETRHQAAARPRGLLRGRPQRARSQDRAQPPDAARRDQRGLQEPHDALQQGLPRGPATAASRAWTSSCSPSTPRASSASPAASPRARASGSSTAKHEDARAHLDELVQVFGPEDVYLEVQKNGLDRAGAGQRGDARLRGGDRPPDGRDRGRPLPPQGGLPPPRGAAVRADEVDAGRAEDVVHDERVLFEVAPRRWRSRSPTSRARSSRRSRSPSAARSTSRSAAS